MVEQIETVHSDPYSGVKSSANFPAFFRLVNGFSDVVFLGVLLFEDDPTKNPSFLILAFGVAFGIAFRQIGAVNYTENGPKSFYLSFMNVFLGSSFKVHKKSSVPRSTLQEYPIENQLSDQLNSHQIADTLQVISSFYAAILLSLNSDSSSNPNFHFYLIKCFIAATTLLFDIVAQEMNTVSLITIIPSGLTLAINQLLFNLSLFRKEADIQYSSKAMKRDFFISTLKFILLCGCLVTRLAVHNRIVKIERQTSPQKCQGLMLVCLFLVLITTDVILIIVGVPDEDVVGTYSNYLANIMVGFFCLVMFAFPWREQVFYNHWLEVDIIRTAVEIGSYDQHYSDTQQPPPTRRKTNVVSNPPSSVTHYSVSNEVFQQINMSNLDELPYEHTL